MSEFSIVTGFFFWNIKAWGAVFAVAAFVCILILALSVEIKGVSYKKTEHKESEGDAFAVRDSVIESAVIFWAENKAAPLLGMGALALLLASAILFTRYLG